MALIAAFALILSGLWLAALADLGGSNARMTIARLAGIAPGSAAAVADRLKAPEGYSISVYAEDLDGPRLLALSTGGQILVSEPSSGRVRMLSADSDGDGRADKVSMLLDGLDRPHGLELADGWLWIAEEGAVRRIRFDEQSGEISGEVETVLPGIPADGGHSTRTIAKGLDGAMYVTTGSSCNVCIEGHPWRAAMLRLDPETGEPAIYATGLRNTVGFDWQPTSGMMFGVDNGRDWLGDESPPDELNAIVESGFYGWPFYNGENVPDPDLGMSEAAPRGEQIAPVYGFSAHVAPLAIHFLSHQDNPDLLGAALVTQHGSWNREHKIGYQVVSLHFTPGGEIEERPFLTGFLDGEKVLGRPVDVVEATDGTIFVSDDYAGAIYRISPTH